MKIKCYSEAILVDYDGTVWPCCHVLARQKVKKSNGTRSKYIDSLPKDWNNLKKHKLKDILKHEAYTKHFNEAHWNDENKADPICKKICDKEKGRSLWNTVIKYNNDKLEQSKETQ